MIKKREANGSTSDCKWADCVDKPSESIWSQDGTPEKMEDRHPISAYQKVLCR